jgi:hypothetical protein
VPLVAQHPLRAEFEYHPLPGSATLNKNNLSQGRFFVPLVAQHPLRAEFEYHPLPGVCDLKEKTVQIWTVFRVPLAEFESATFCSASKRSIQLRYRGIGLIFPAPYLYRAGGETSRTKKNPLLGQRDFSTMRAGMRLIN